VVLFFFHKITKELKMLSNAELKQQAYTYGWNRILSHFGVDGACLGGDNKALDYGFFTDTKQLIDLNVSHWFIML
jgi:hypothetical protein